MAELGDDLVLLWELPTGPVFVVGRFTKIRGQLCFAATQDDNRRLQTLGLDPFRPQFWTYYLRGKQYVEC